MVGQAENEKTQAWGMSEALSLTFDEQVFSFETGVVFRGLSITPKPKGFNIVLRVSDRHGKALYAMSFHKKPSVGLRNLMEAICRKGGLAMFHADKFAP